MSAQGSTADGPLPEVAEVERLILTLYRTRDPEERSSVDRTLIDVQRSSHGFRLADQLLHSEHDEARFYGARIFIVKINRDLKSLDEDAQNELLQRLVYWFVTATRPDYSMATFRKICSAIAAYFIHVDGDWKKFIITLRLALLQSQWKPENSASNAPQGSQQLSVKSQRALLIFISTLLQEVAALEADGSVSHQLDTLIKDCLSPIIEIIEKSLNEFTGQADTLSTTEEAIETYRSLVMWMKTASHDDETISSTVIIANKVMSFMLHPDLSTSVCQFIYEVLVEFPSFFTEKLNIELAAALSTSQARELLNQLTAGVFEDEPLWIGKLLVAYGEARVDSLVKYAPMPGSQALLQQLLIPLTCFGVPAAEDPVVTPALEFWSNFVETVREQNEENMHNTERWLSWNGGILKNLLLCVRARVKHPEIEQWKGLTPDEKKLFAYFRSDARDLLGSLETFFGISITLDTVSKIIEYTQTQDWLGVEASFFCLNSILSQVDYDEKSIRQISDPLFRSPVGSPSVIEQIRAATMQIPAIVFKEVIVFFSATESLAQHDSRLLLLILQCLAEWFNLRALAMSAATVFAHVCFHSREAVVQTGAGNQLLSLLQTYASTTARDFVVQEKLAGAVAAISQAYAANAAPEAAVMLDTLLDLINRDVQLSLVMQASEPDSARAMGLCALRCLENMGKAFRVPEHAIDLEDDEQPPQPSFWALHPTETQAAQSKILGQCTAILQPFNGPEEVNAVCHILKSGYTESEPGPFVFSLDATATLLKVCHLTTPSIGEVFKNVSVLLEKHKSRKSLDWVQHFAKECLEHVQSMIQPYFQNEPSHDPEVAALVMDFLKAYVPAFNSLLCTTTQRSLDALDFATACLASNEILPKQSAALFWARFLKVPTGSEEPGYIEIMDRYSQGLTQILIQQIGGGASRSDLEYFAEPVKTIVFKGGVFRNYMKDALANLETQDNRVSDKEKRVFLEKLFSLRGGARSGKVIQEFWAQCRGTFVLS